MAPQVAPTVVDATETQAKPAVAATAAIQVKGITPSTPTVPSTATITLNQPQAGDWVGMECSGQVSLFPYGSATATLLDTVSAIGVNVYVFTTRDGLLRELNQELSGINDGGCNFTAQPSGADAVVLTYVNFNAAGSSVAPSVWATDLLTPGGISVTPFGPVQVGHAADSVTVGGVAFTASRNTTCTPTDTTGCTNFSGARTLALAITRDRAQTGAVAALDPNSPDTVDLTATQPGSSGNAIALTANNPADDLVTPFTGGSDGTPATYVLVFNQAIQPSTFPTGTASGVTAVWSGGDTVLTVTASPAVAQILPVPGQTLTLPLTVQGQNGRALVGSSPRVALPVPTDRAVAFAASLGLLSGVDGLAPGAPVTRAQAVDAVAAVLGLTGGDSAGPYTDLADRFDAGLLAAAQADGLMAGWADPASGVTTFAPDAPITRADLAVLATDALGLQAQAADLANGSAIQTAEAKYPDLLAAGPAPVADMVLMMAAPTAVVPPLSPTTDGPTRHVTVQTLALALARLWRLLDVPTAIAPTATLSATSRGPVTVNGQPGTNAMNGPVRDAAWESSTLTLPQADSACTVSGDTVSCPPGVHTVDLTVAVPGSGVPSASGQATFAVPNPAPPTPPIQVTSAVETASTATPATALLDVSGVQAAVAAQPATTATATITLTNPQPGDTLTWTDATDLANPTVILTYGYLSQASSLAAAINAIGDPNVGTATASGDTATIPWASAGSGGDTGPVTISTTDPTGILISPFSGGADATAAIAADTVTVGTKTLTAGVDFSTPQGLATAITQDQAETGAIATYDATSQEISLTATAFGSAGNGQTLSVSSQVQDIALVNGFTGGTTTLPQVSLTFGAPIDQTTLTSANFASVLTPSTGTGFGSGATGAWNTTGTPGTVFTITLGSGTFLPGGTTVAIASSVKGAQGQAVGSPSPTLTVPVP